MFKSFIFILTILTNIVAQDDLSLLLNDYEEKSQLHNKTKVESAGHLIIYSRDDLDKMQAHTLNDILKSTRLFSLQETQNGQTGLQRSGARCTNSGCIRLYINNQELSSITNSSALMIFKNYNLALIDHIELYIGGNAVSFGNEYGFITIKLYTKTPSREKGTLLSLTTGSNSTKRGEFLNAGVLEENYEYLIYGSKDNNTYNSIYNGYHEIKRYDDISNIYLNISKEKDFLLEFSQYKTNHDALAGDGIEKTPTNTFEKATYQYIALTKFVNDFKIQVSYAKEKNLAQNIDNNGIKLVTGDIVNKIEQEFDNSVSKFSIQHSSTFGNHNLLYGIDYQDKKLNLTKLNHDDIDISDTFISDSELKLYSIFLEDSYNINKNNIIIATAKYEKYQHIGSDKSDYLHQLRFGYVSIINDLFTIKSFATDNNIYPSAKEFSQYPRVIDGNPDLKPIHVNNYSIELIHQRNKHKINLMFMKMIIQDPIKINSSNHYFTKENIDAKFYDSSIDYAYDINKNNKIKLQYYTTHHNRPFDASPLEGGFIKVMNAYDKVSLYNELIYRKGYISPNNIKIGDGYDFTSAISYQINKNLTISLKGENLLDKAIASPIEGFGPVQTSQKQTNLRIEWFF